MTGFAIQAHTQCGPLYRTKKNTWVFPASATLRPEYILTFAEQWEAEAWARTLALRVSYPCTVIEWRQ